MSEFLRRPLPLYLMAFFSTLVLLQFFINIPELNTAVTYFSQWATALAAFVLVVGIVNVLHHHYRVYQKREEKRWYFSVWAIFLIITLTAYGLWVGGAYTANFEWFWFTLSAWPYSSTLTVQCLYQFSAGYRAFRARSIEATLLLVGAFITILGYSPLTATLFPAIQNLATWLANYPAAASNRGVLIGTGVGALALGIRIVLGREKQMGG